MASNKIAFNNLRAEMGRKNLNICDIAKSLGVNRDTLGRKLSKKAPLNLDEAFKIQRFFFPNLDIWYLFADDRNEQTGQEQEEQT